MMELAINKAKGIMKEGISGPFGTVIVKNDKVLAVTSNTVLGTHNPIAHAEINIIRKTSKVLVTHDFI